MRPLPPHGVRLVVAVAAAALVLGVATTVALAATGVLRRGPAGGWRPAAGRQCTAPALPGHVVDVTLTDMGRGMMGGPDGYGPGGYGPGGYGPGGYGPGGYGMGMMRLVAAPGAVPAGTVSLRVFNAGVLRHEVVVLPLPPGQSSGARVVGTDGRVDEAGSVGEASRSCSAGQGEGIDPGAAAWTTMTLQPGRYELLCNIPGHYAYGMYTELDVTG